MRLIAPAALAGCVTGIGLGLSSNVPGGVLALYGLVLGALFGTAAIFIARRRR